MWITAVLAGVTLPLAAQYPGQVANSGKNTPTLRAVAVFEWTGDEAKPKASRLVPVCVYDGQELQDADDYLARPAPIALYSDVEYQLFKDGKPVGLFDVDRAGQRAGFLDRLRQVETDAPRQAHFYASGQDRRRRRCAERCAHPAPQASWRRRELGHRRRFRRIEVSGSGPDPSAPPPDPDRPTLHKGGDASAGNSGAVRARIPVEFHAASPAAMPPAPTAATPRILARVPALRRIPINLNCIACPIARPQPTPITQAQKEKERRRELREQCRQRPATLTARISSAASPRASMRR